MNVAPPAIGAGLTGKNQDFILGPLLVPRQNGQGDALVAARFGLGLGPGAEFFLLGEKEVSAGKYDDC